MSLYQAIPKTSHALTEVATGTALKTVLQIATPSTTGIRIVAWGVSFEGVVVTGAPGEITLIDTNVAATVTTLTPEKFGNQNAQSSLCVGGTSATGYNATAEGTITGSAILDGQKVHPQTGYSLWFPADARPVVAVSRFLRVRCSFAVDRGLHPVGHLARTGIAGHAQHSL